MGSLSLLQGIFPTPWVKPRSLRLQTDSLPAEPQGSPRILGWIAYPFSSEFSWPRNQTGVSCIMGRLFTNWAIREAQVYSRCSKSGAIIIVIWLLSRLNHSFSHCQLELSQIFCYYSRLKLLLDPLNSFCLFSRQSGHNTFHLRAQSCLSNQ